MAGHGGGGGGHGGAAKSSGIRINTPTLPRNGCLRYLVLWVIALVLLLLGVFGSALRLIPSLPGLSALTAGSTSIQSQTNLPAAPAAVQPAAAAGSSSGTTAQGGGNAATAPSAAISSAPLQGLQGTLITPYTEPAFYIVRPRDTLEAVAAMFGTTAAELRYYNGLTSDALLIGQVLYLPPVAYNPVPSTGRNAGHDTQPPSNDNNGDQ
jgi:LysM repeat protein